MTSEAKTERPPQLDELHNYWCPKCQSWQMFRWEDKDYFDCCDADRVDFKRVIYTEIEVTL